MELRHLRYFLAVAHTLNFGRAAAMLGIAQPPLSVQIRDLEREVGSALFVRGARGVTLTDAGIAFAQHATSVLESSERALEAARDAAAGRGGRLVVGFIPALAYSLLPQILPPYRAAHPQVALALREVQVTDKEDALLSGTIDVGLYRPPARHPEIDSVRLGHEQMILAMPADHRLAKRRRIAPAWLADERIVTYPPSRGDAGLYGCVAKFLQQHRIRPDATDVAGTIHTALGLVLAGAGVALVPESAAGLRLRGLVFRPFDGAPAQVDVMVCWRKADPSRLVAQFVQRIRQVPLKGVRSPTADPRS